MQNPKEPQPMNSRYYNILFALYCIIGMFLCGCEKRTEFHLNNKDNIMGTNVQIELFNYQVYNDVVLPAYKEFLQKNNSKPLKNLLIRAINERKLIDSDDLDVVSVLELEEALGILEGNIYYSSKGLQEAQSKTTQDDLEIFVRGSVGPELVRLFCIDRLHGINPTQSMTQGPLIRYLYTKSEWIKEIFTFEKEIASGSLEIAIGECTEIMPKKEVAIFYDEVLKASKPSGNAQLCKDYENLCKMLKTALDNVELVIVRTQ
jgi:hypothetical protein